VLLLGVLHFMKFREAKGVLNKVNQIIENNGYLVIAANHIENKNMTDPDYTEKVVLDHTNIFRAMKPCIFLMNSAL